MAQLKSAIYQGVEELTEDDCLKIARLKTKNVDATVENVTLVTFSDAPVGFLGDHYKLIITVRLGNESKKSEESIDLHFFVKTKPRNPAHTEFGESMGAFKRECDFFSTLSGLLNKYANNTEGCDKDQKRWTPDCYFANENLIVLDNLSHQGYCLSEGRLGLDYDHCVILFQTMARFHVSCLIYEEKEGQLSGKPLRLNESHPEMVSECFLTVDPKNAGRRICRAGTNAGISLVKQILETTKQPERYERVLQAFGTMFEDSCRLVKTSSEHRNVVCHSDLWFNNILFRYGSKGTPEDARLIDYQLIRYSAPGTDFMIVIYLNMRREMREANFLALAKVYHSTLAEELAKHNLKVEEIVPWAEFMSSLEHFRLLGFLHCFVYYPTTLLSDEVAKEVVTNPEIFEKFMLEDQSAIALKCFESDVNYRDRLSEIIEELADYLTNK